PNRNNQYAYGLNENLAMMSLAYSARFKLDPPKNKRQLTNLPVGDIAALKNNPGVYVAVMQEAGHYGDYRLPITWFVISDIGLHARVYRDEIQVLTHSIANAEPLEKVQLSLLDQNGKTLVQTQTNADGSANFPSYPKTAKVLFAKRNGQTAVLNLNAPALDLTAFDLPSKREQKPLHSFTYSARELYRPGESITFSTLLRNGDALMAGTPVLTARIFRPDGQQVRQFVMHGNALAYYQQEYGIPLDAPTGEWRFQVLAGEQALDEYHFKVEEFLPERMKLTLDDGQDAPHFVSSSEAIQIPVDGQYLYGAPAANNRLVSKVVVNPLRQPFDHYKDFEFGQIDEENTVQQFDLPDLTLNEQGKATLEVPNQWAGVKSPLDVNVIANLEESGGRPVTRQIHYSVWPNDTGVIGIRLNGDAKQIQYDSAVQFDIIKVNEKGERVAAKELQVQLIRHRRDYYWSWDSDWNSNYTEKQYQVYSTTVSVGKNEPAQVEVPVEWGPYRLVVTDPATHTVSSFRFEAGYGWYEQKDAVLAARPDEVKILLDKPAYRAGDTVHAKIRSPHAGEAIVMVEGDKLLWQKRLKVGTDVTDLDIPVKAEWQQHNLYVTALVLRPGNAPNKVTPRRAVGITHLALDRSDRKLEVSVDLPADKVRPETDVITTVKVKGISSGKTAMVTLAAVDVGVLNITDYATPDPFKWF
ncbi:MAG TPA: MG2 domain-containing protein, partial [Pseudomonadales bacterium]|nr:MG2 domain-containing protein [Pseudomonadales bacterium]